MASVRVAVRVRPMNRRETELDAKCIIRTEGSKTSITNLKVPEGVVGDSMRERTRTFTYDFSYDSTDGRSRAFISQETVFRDLGSDVLKAAFEGYNACVFAYGQTGSGKSYTMMGVPGDAGLIPRICEGLFSRIADASRRDDASFRTEVSYLEIYNERVRDLLRRKSSHTFNLRVREHPQDGPYVEDLSKHLVQNYGDVEELMEAGNINRTTASTGMNDVSSRSHAIFTINFTQAKFDAEMPSETVSKIHLVDLAGSERADATGASGVRLKEGGNINKSLVTLGNVISALADMAPDGGNQKKKTVFVPYRDSVLTWLLKDSLGGNAKTIMIATVSPADLNYGETLSTLRYANRAKNIVNKPTVNEDSNVRLIRELRAEIARLKALLLQGSQIALLDSPTALSMEEKLHQNEARVLELTKEWTNKWNETQNILKEETLALRKEGIGVVLDSELPHLIGIDDDLLSTGIILYHLKEGRTYVGREDASGEQDIILHGLDLESEHCVFENQNGTVTLVPLGAAQCSLNGVLVAAPVQLNQGAVILLGRTNMFRFNHPKEAAKLREKRKSGLLSSFSLSMTDLSKSCENLSAVMLYNPGLEFERQQREELEKLEMKRRLIKEMEEKQLSEKAELERLQQEVESQRKESQEVQQRILRQEESLRRRSRDIESRLRDFLAEKERFEEERRSEVQEVAPQQEEQEATEIRRELQRLRREAERRRLEEQEREAQEAAAAQLAREEERRLEEERRVLAEIREALLRAKEAAERTDGEDAAQEAQVEEQLQQEAAAGRSALQQAAARLQRRHAALGPDPREEQEIQELRRRIGGNQNRAQSGGSEEKTGHSGSPVGELNPLLPEDRISSYIEDEVQRRLRKMKLLNGAVDPSESCDSLREEEKLQSMKDQRRRRYEDSCWSDLLAPPGSGANRLPDVQNLSEEPETQLLESSDELLMEKHLDKGQWWEGEANLLPRKEIQADCCSKATDQLSGTNSMTGDGFYVLPDSQDLEKMLNQTFYPHPEETVDDPTFEDPELSKLRINGSMRLEAEDSSTRLYQDLRNVQNQAQKAAPELGLLKLQGSGEEFESEQVWKVEEMKQEVENLLESRDSEDMDVQNQVEEELEPSDSHVSDDDFINSGRDSKPDVYQPMKLGVLDSKNNVLDQLEKNGADEEETADKSGLLKLQSSGSEFNISEQDPAGGANGPAQKDESDNGNNFLENQRLNLEGEEELGQDKEALAEQELTNRSYIWDSVSKVRSQTLQLWTTRESELLKWLSSGRDDTKQDRRSVRDEAEEDRGDATGRVSTARSFVWNYVTKVQTLNPWRPEEPEQPSDPPNSSKESMKSGGSEMGREKDEAPERESSTRNNVWDYVAKVRSQTLHLWRSDGPESQDVHVISGLDGREENEKPVNMTKSDLRDYVAKVKDQALNPWRAEEAEPTTSQSSEKGSSRDPGETNRSHVLGYFTGKLSDVFKDAERRIQDTTEFIRNVGVSQYVTMRSRDFPPIQTTKLPSVLENKVSLVDLSSPAQEFAVNAMSMWPKGSVSSVRGPEDGGPEDGGPEQFYQSLVEFPPALARLRSLSSQEIIDRTEPLSPQRPGRRILSLFWLRAASLDRPGPEPACLLLSQQDLTVVSAGQGASDTLGLFHHFDLMEIREVQIGLAGQHVRLIGSSEDSVLAVFTHSQELTQDLCKAVLKARGAETFSERHPLLSQDLMAPSLDWTSRVPDMVSAVGLILTSRFKRVLADLLYVVHGNMDVPSRPALADVRPLLYSSVRVRRCGCLAQFLLTDSHVALLREDGVFHPAPRGSGRVPVRPQFQGLKLRRRSDIRCLLVRRSEAHFHVDVVFTDRHRQTRKRQAEPRRRDGPSADCLSADGPSADCLSADGPSADCPSADCPSCGGRTEPWRLSFGCPAEAQILINHLCS